MVHPIILLYTYDNMNMSKNIKLYYFGDKMWIHKVSKFQFYM